MSEAVIGVCSFIALIACGVVLGAFIVRKTVNLDMVRRAKITTAGSNNQTKAASYYVELYPGWQDNDWDPKITQDPPTFTQINGSRIVRVLVDLPVIPPATAEIIEAKVEDVQL